MWVEMGTYVPNNEIYNGHAVYTYASMMGTRSLWFSTAANRYMVADYPGYSEGLIDVFWNGTIPTSIQTSIIDGLDNCGNAGWKNIYNILVLEISTVCLSCPTQSTSANSTNTITVCRCNAGFTGADGDTCSKCGAGTYKTGIGSASCEACPANS